MSQERNTSKKIFLKCTQSMLSTITENFSWSYHYFELTAEVKTCYFLEMMLECSTGSHFTGTAMGSCPRYQMKCCSNHLDVTTGRNGWRTEIQSKHCLLVTRSCFWFPLLVPISAAVKDIWLCCVYFKDAWKDTGLARKSVQEKYKHWSFQEQHLH